jgi:hypothetical protein
MKTVKKRDSQEMSIPRFDYDRRTGRNVQPQRHVMPVVTKMPLVRFAAAVERHTRKHGTPPDLIWPTDSEATRLSQRIKR